MRLTGTRLVRARARAARAGHQCERYKGCFINDSTYTYGTRRYKSNNMFSVQH